MKKEDKIKPKTDPQLEMLAMFFPQKGTSAFNRTIKTGMASIVLEYKEKIEELKKRQDGIIKNFIKKVEEKKINEIRKGL